MADANCDVTYTTEEDCCGVDLQPPTTEPPPVEPPPEEPPPEEPPPSDDSGCPYYCGFGSPEGVQESVFEDADVSGGEYLQLDSALTTHPWWAKYTVGGLTGWKAWAGLASEGALSYRLGDNSLATGANALALGTGTNVDSDNGIGLGQNVDINAARGIGIGQGRVDAVEGISIGDGRTLNINDISIGWSHDFGASVAHPSIIIGKNGTILTGTDSSSSISANYGGHILIGEDTETPYAASQFHNVVIGYQAKARGRASTIIGDQAQGRVANDPVSGISAAVFATLIGYLVKGSGGCIVAVGDQADVRGDNVVAVGTHSRANDSNTAAFGPNAFAGSLTTDGTGALSCAFGVGTQALKAQSSAYGALAVAKAVVSGAYGPSTFIDTAFEASTALGFGATPAYPRVLMIGGHPDAGTDIVTAIHFNGSSTPAFIVSPSGQVLINDVLGISTSNQFPIAADHTLTANERTWIANANAAARTITLPTAASVPNGTHVYVIKSDSSGNQVHVQRNGTDTLDGGTAQFNLTAQWKWALFKRTSGTNWNTDYNN